jgi:hypothetical protein
VYSTRNTLPKLPQHSYDTPSHALQVMAQPRMWTLDYGWTTGNDPSITHQRRIDAGSGGEVHEVRISFPFKESNHLDVEYSDESGEKY